MTNWAVVKQPRLELDRVVGEVDHLFQAAPYILVCPWPTVDLRHLGLALVGHPPLMYRPPPPPDMQTPADLETRWATDVVSLHHAERVVVDGYPIPELQPCRPGSVYARLGFLRVERWTLWVRG